MHQVLCDVFAEWTRLRRDGLAPERTALTPANIAPALPDVLVLAIDADAGHPVRLAGSRVCALFGGELRGRSLLSLFDPRVHGEVAALVERIADSQLPVRAVLAGAGLEHGPLPLELLLLPLRVDGNPRERLFGVLATASMPWWLVADPIRILELRRTLTLVPGETPAPPTAPVRIPGEITAKRAAPLTHC